MSFSLSSELLIHLGRREQLVLARSLLAYVDTVRATRPEHAPAAEDEAFLIADKLQILPTYKRLQSIARQPEGAAS